MRFALWLKEPQGGCDYTIGCGNRLYLLKAETSEAAFEEAKAVLLDQTYVKLMDNTDQPNNDSRIFQQALLLTLTSDMSVIADAVGEKKRREAVAERRAEKLAQIERLKLETGDSAKRADDREDLIDRASQELTKLLRDNGHKIDDSNDYALLMNVLRRHFSEV